MAEAKKIKASILAKKEGISPRHARRLRATGDPRAFEDPNNPTKIPEGADPVEDVKTHRAKYWKHRAEREKLAEQEEAKRLIPADEVKQVYVRQVHAAKSILLGTQPTLAAVLSSLTGADANMLQERIAARDREVLERLASGKWWEEPKE